MAELPPLLVNQTRWSDLLKQLAVLKGLDHVELLAELRGCIVLENDRPEHKYLAGEALAWGQYLLAAQGAGVVGYIALQNPSGSGKLIVCTKVRAMVELMGRFYVGIARGATVTLRSTEQPRDTRVQPTGAFGTAAPGIAGQIVSAVTATIAVLPFVVAEIGGGHLTTNLQSHAAELDDPVVLAPGDQLFVWLSDGAGSTLANTAFEASFVWRERTLEPTET